MVLIIHFRKVFITKFTERLIIAKDGVDNSIIISGLREYGHLLIFTLVKKYKEKKGILFKSLINMQ